MTVVDGLVEHRLDAVQLTLLGVDDDGISHVVIEVPPLIRVRTSALAGDGELRRRHRRMAPGGGRQLGRRGEATWPASTARGEYQGKINRLHGDCSYSWHRDPQSPPRGS